LTRSTPERVQVGLFVVAFQRVEVELFVIAFESSLSPSG